ncbi:MAG: epoxyqueuosine reductase [Myxococcota bacterium]|jgi:epoxyqueuosine reductase
MSTEKAKEMKPGPEQAASDAEAGFDIGPDFERFHQKNDVFSRSFWDDEVRSGRSELFYETYRTPLKKWKNVDGFKQRDYAIRNASWHLPDIFAELKQDEDRREGFLDEFTVLREGPETQVPVEDPRAQAHEVKHVAKTFGADLIGITGRDERWLYASKYSRAQDGMKAQELPDGLNNVIVIAQAMDRDLIRTVPSALSGTATGIGYSQDTVVLLALAQYIVNLGYRAVPSMNDTALAIPYALKAGLGEYGRHGLLITEEFGPRVRLGKIFTDLPLAHDLPKTFGVQKFCESCRACTAACPAKAIPGGEPSREPHNKSNHKGVLKWSVDGVKCFKFWANQNSDCSICVRVCPYNRDYTKRVNRIWRKLAGTTLRGLMLRYDRWSKRGQRMSPAHWWP